MAKNHSRRDARRACGCIRNGNGIAPRRRVEETLLALLPHRSLSLALSHSLSVFLSRSPFMPPIEYNCVRLFVWPTTCYRVFPYYCFLRAFSRSRAPFIHNVYCALHVLAAATRLHSLVHANTFRGFQQYCVKIALSKCILFHYLIFTYP
jgi:hypothetical protein